jgi:lipoate-protein ligase A
MRSIFDHIVYMPGTDPLEGAVQMALDELLLSETGGVLLRDYRWLSPTRSIGYFGTRADLQPAAHSPSLWQLIRRPTGGGLVEHGHGLDFTYSIVVSAAAARARQLSLRASYRAIHGVLSQVLLDFGVRAALAAPDQEGAGGAACFTNPVSDDLMLDGKKIAGAGQKRSRGAILHQGSIQPLKLPPDFGSAFAQGLAEQVEVVALDPSLLAHAENLANEKYRCRAWNQRR